MFGSRNELQPLDGSVVVATMSGDGSKNWGARATVQLLPDVMAVTDLAGAGPEMEGLKQELGVSLGFSLLQRQLLPWQGVRLDLERLEPEPGAGCEPCWSSLGRTARAPGSFQSSTSALGLGASKSMHVLFKSRVSASYSPPVSPTDFQTSQGGSSSQSWIPGLGCPMWGLNPLLPREDSWACDIPFLFWVSHQGCGD